MFHSLLLLFRRRSPLYVRAFVCLDLCLLRFDSLADVEQSILDVAILVSTLGGTDLDRYFGGRPRGDEGDEVTLDSSTVPGILHPRRKEE